jgi:predicted Rossmann fold nucleotide-binding protein DprA/Smf involved in DNA uptake
LAAPAAHPARESRAQECDDPQGDPLQARLASLLRLGERSLDELLHETGEAPAQVFAALSMLELRGAVEARPGQRYGTRR